MRRRQHLGWIFRAERAGPTRWVSRRSEGARRRAGTHPQLRQQSREPAWRQGEQSDPTEASTLRLEFVHAFVHGGSLDFGLLSAFTKNLVRRG